jgi:hypothetical protein
MPGPIATRLVDRWRLAVVLGVGYGQGRWPRSFSGTERHRGRCGRSLDGSSPAPHLNPDALSGPFWNAWYGGQTAAAKYLLAHDADLNWHPGSRQTPLTSQRRQGGAML